MCVCVYVCVCCAFVGLDNTKYTVHVLDKYSENKEEEFRGKVREKKQRNVKTASYNKHLCWYSNYGLLRAHYEPTVCGK